MKKLLAALVLLSACNPSQNVTIIVAAPDMAMAASDMAVADSASNPVPMQDMTTAPTPDLSMPVAVDMAKQPDLATPDYHHYSTFLYLYDTQSNGDWDDSNPTVDGSSYSQALTVCDTLEVRLSLSGQFTGVSDCTQVTLTCDGVHMYPGVKIAVANTNTYHAYYHMVYDTGAGKGLACYVDYSGIYHTSKWDQ